MSRKTFQLRVESDSSTDYGLALYRLPARGESDALDDDGWQFVVRVHGVPMRAVMDQILATIKQAGYRVTDLARNRKNPFALSEEQGVRLGLLMLAVKPLRKTTRMSDVSEHVRGMTAEEAYYWFSKVTDASQGRRSQKALRILLAKE
ncbi:MAG: hypothetical protein FJ276_29365 [Planctomycetes bacterium]|nr:hypothetical protein [Planctomycetota bacterium]